MVNLEAFTDCDHLFDQFQQKGTFSLPIFPRDPINETPPFIGGEDDSMMKHYGSEEVSSTQPTYIASESNDGIQGFDVLPANIQVYWQ